MRDMQQGQSLLETVVAIGIVVTGLIGIFTLVIGNLNAQRESVTRLIAVNLAREGIEIVRNIRDTNWMNGTNAWMGILGTDVRAIDALSAPLTKIPEFDPVKLSDVTGDDTRVYNVGGTLRQGSGASNGTVTAFRRSLTIEPFTCAEANIGSANECAQEGFIEAKSNSSQKVAIKVTSRVVWLQNGRDREVTVADVFYDWR